MPQQSRTVRTPVLLALIASFVAACAPAGATPAPSGAVTAVPTAEATEAPTPSSRATPAPAPSGVLHLPTGFAQELEPGTYWSAPPFDIGFSFEVAEEGWVAGHLNPEFVDIQRHAGVPTEGVMPERVVGFAHPLVIHGSTMIEAADLSPAAAVQLWVDRTDVETANVEELELLGRDAVRVDLHAPVPMLPLFGGDDGTFRLDSALDVRPSWLRSMAGCSSRPSTPRPRTSRQPGSRHSRSSSRSTCASDPRPARG